MEYSGSLKRLVVLCWLGLAGGLSTTACGSDDPAPPPPSPSAQCNTLLDTYCSRAADCAEELTCTTLTRKENYDDCMSAIKTGLDCTKAVSVGSAYGTCLSKTKVIACSAFGTATACMAAQFPAECSMVVTIKEN